MVLGGRRDQSGQRRWREGALVLALTHRSVLFWDYNLPRASLKHPKAVKYVLQKLETRGRFSHSKQEHIVHGVTAE
jgi:hypothetical protein